MSDASSDAVSSGIWRILLTLSVATCTVLLRQSNFGLSLALNSVADFSKTLARAPTSAESASYFQAWRAMWFGHVVWIWVMVIFRWLYFYFISRNYPYRCGAVVSCLNHLVLAVELRGFFCPVSGETCRRLIVGFIRLTSHPPCFFPWFLKFLCVGKKIPL